jgi:glycine/serine hydroxymethyltransferase
MLEMHEYGAAYAQQVVANAVALGTALETRGFDLIRAGSAPTQSNVILINHTKTVDVFQSCDRLFRAGIATNARTLNGRGILRLGTQEITRRGMREPEMELIADLVYRAVSNTEQGPRIRREIAALMDSYNKVHYSFDEALGF